MEKLHYGDYINIDNPPDVPYLKSCSFLDYFKFLLDDNFLEMEQHLLSSFPNLGLKSIPTLTDDQMIEGMLVVSERDYQKKLKGKNYYKCNIACFIKTFREVFTQGLYNAVNQEVTPALTVYNYSHILKHMLFDVDCLIDIYNQVFCNSKPKSMRKGQIHYFELHQVLRQ